MTIRLACWFLLVLALLVQEAALGQSRQPHAVDAIDSALQALSPEIPQTSEDPRSVVAPGVTVLLSSPAQRRDTSGVLLTRNLVELGGSIEKLFFWMTQVESRGFVAAPPWTLRRLGPELTLQISLWSVRGQAKPGSTDEELQSLQQNLDWMLQQRQSAAAHLNLMGMLLDHEGVDFRSASWQSGNFQVAGVALDGASRDSYLLSIRNLAQSISRSIALDAGEIKVVEAAGLGPESLQIVELQPKNILRLLAWAGGKSLILSAADLPPLSARFSGEESDLLLDQVLKQLPWQHRRLGSFWIVAEKLDGDPPASVPGFASSRLFVDFQNAQPRDLFFLLTEGSKLQLIPVPLLPRSTTLMVQDQSPTDAVRLLAWSIGRLPVIRGPLLAMLPSNQPPPASKEVSSDTVDLAAIDAPLSDLIFALSLEKPAIACMGDDPRVTLTVSQASAASLLDLLQASYGMGSSSKDAMTDPCQPSGAPARKEDSMRLSAILRGPASARALVFDADRLRWLSEGDKLSDGSLLKKITPSRVLIRTADGALQKVEPTPLARPSIDASLPLPPMLSAVGLSQLRLAATLRIRGREAGVLVDPQGQAMIVRVGNLVGRRCGKIVSIQSNSLRVALGCPGAFEPKEILVPLRPKIQ